MINLKKIIIPFDGSENSILAVKYGASFVAEYAAELTIVYVAETSNLESIDLKLHDSLNVRKKLAEIHRSRIEEMLNDGAGAILSGIDYNLEILPGNVVNAVVDYAKEIEADLIIIGSYGMSEYKPAWLGSSTYQIVKAATCPVLTVKTKEREFVV
jgi:nucleotide-binding universal stress UspA family protein